MKSCFSKDSKKRPGASTIVEFISNNPRMLTPCLMDVPKPNLDEQVSLIDASSVENEFDQLMENCNRSLPPAIVTVDFLRSSASSSALHHNACRPQEFDYLDMKPRRLNGTYGPDLTATLPNANYNLPLNYNPVEPLLRPQPEISKSTLSLMKYVPMCGFNKNRNRTPPDECTSAL
jgi:hypothetical protein